ncbi:MAG: potassium channel protein [Actinomycetia bacterium]|nr:potassium channel protein [Actinomycetes bacterium]
MTTTSSTGRTRRRLRIGRRVLRLPLNGLSPRLYGPVVLLAVVILAGTLGYMVLGLSTLDALYQTVITVSTVGYRELSDGGVTMGYKIFTVFLILGGTGSMLYGAGVFVESLLEGRLTGEYRRYRMHRHIEELNGHVVICGQGRMGRAIAEYAKSTQQTIVVIDELEERAEAMGFPFIQGNATHDDTLRQAGIERAAVAIVALGSDADNVYVTLSVRSLNPTLFLVARATGEGAIPKLRQAGADRVVDPYEIGGTRMGALAFQPAVTDFLDVVLHDDEYAVKVQELAVPDTSSALGHNLAELSLREQTGAVVLAVRDRVGKFHTDDVHTRPFLHGDLLIAIGTDTALHRLAERLRT